MGGNGQKLASATTVTVENAAKQTTKSRLPDLLENRRENVPENVLEVYDKAIMIAGSIGVLKEFEKLMVTYCGLDNDYLILTLKRLIKSMEKYQNDPEKLKKGLEEMERLMILFPKVADVMPKIVAEFYDVPSIILIAMIKIAVRAGKHCPKHMTEFIDEQVETNREQIRIINDNAPQPDKKCPYHKILKWLKRIYALMVIKYSIEQKIGQRETGYENLLPGIVRAVAFENRSSRTGMRVPHAETDRGGFFEGAPEIAFDRENTHETLSPAGNSEVWNMNSFGMTQIGNSNPNIAYRNLFSDRTGADENGSIANRYEENYGVATFELPEQKQSARIGNGALQFGLLGMHKKASNDNSSLDSSSDQKDDDLDSPGLDRKDTGEKEKFEQKVQDEIISETGIKDSVDGEIETQMNKTMQSQNGDEITNGGISEGEVSGMQTETISAGIFSGLAETNNRSTGENQLENAAVHAEMNDGSVHSAAMETAELNLEAPIARQAELEQMDAAPIVEIPITRSTEVSYNIARGTPAERVARVVAKRMEVKNGKKSEIVGLSAKKEKAKKSKAEIVALIMDESRTKRKTGYAKHGTQKAKSGNK
ncbi:hypothetical protein HZC07_03460 [Candidatus Micrarchaeota archaeon]|nr:hypothetical protein [Candidatus Micrarchaeota archaeon]